MPHFSRAEAEALLPRVRPLVEDLQRRAESFQRRPSDPVAREIRALMEEIAAPGVEIKDPLQGLIDFRTVRGGREGYLCWRMGEGERILYWHDLESGFAVRKPLDG